MRLTHRSVQALCLTVLVGTSSACVTDVDPTGGTTTTTATGSHEAATSTPPPASDEVEVTADGPKPADLEDKGQEAAAEAVEQFWAKLDELSQNPKIEVQELAEVARGQAVAQWVSNIQSRRERNSVQSGDTRVTVTQVKTIKKGERYEVTACLDLSKVKFNDVKPDRGELGDQQQITYVVRPDVGSGELYVTDDPLEYEACGR